MRIVPALQHEPDSYWRHHTSRSQEVILIRAEWESGRDLSACSGLGIAQLLSGRFPPLSLTATCGPAEGSAAEVALISESFLLC